MRLLVGIVLGVSVAGCAALARPRQTATVTEPTRGRAQQALDQGNPSAAIAELLLVSGNCPSTPAQRHALLSAAAVALDPSNTDRQLNLGANLAARYLTTAPRGDVDGIPLARSLYLIALELGATPVSATGCVSADSAAARLPQSLPQSMPERIKTLERELSRLRDELVRIRKTLEPSK